MNKGVYPEMQSSDGFRMDPDSMRKYLVPVLAGLIAILAAACVILLSVASSRNKNYLNLTMRGPEQIELSRGETYTEAGASAQFRSTNRRVEDASVPVSISGTVDTDTPGVYYVVYRAEHEGLTRHARRRIVVRDHTAPKISLSNEPDHYTLPGQTYEEEGFSASDDVEGDLTQRVLRKEKDGKVYYFAFDLSGNMASAVRDIVYDDRTAPVLTLLDVPEEIIAGDPWEDSFTAVEDVLGDCTDRVTVSGEIDNYVPADYVLDYSVTDDYGNTATAQRIVTVRPVPKNDLGKAVSGEKIVFLTFDDGPGKYTKRLLKILKKYEVPATFFVTAQYSDYLPLIKDEAKAGHTVAVHSLTHDYDKIYSSEEAYWEDFDAMNDVIEKYTGKRTTIFRFPGGSSNMVSSFNEGVMTRLTVQAQRKGYDYYDWNVLSGDAGDTTDPDEIAENILAGIGRRNISVVLCHDIHKYTVDAIEPVLREAIENGYTFLPITPGCVECHHPVNN